MTKKLYLLVLVFLSISYSMYAQNKDYPKTDDELDADRMFEVEEYSKAVLLYENCLKLSPKNFRVINKVAQCYENMLNYERAERAYANATKVDQSPWPLSMFKYGVMLKVNGKYAEAKNQFEAFLTFESEDPEKKKYDQRAIIEYNGCLMAMTEMQKPIRDFSFKDLPAPANSKNSDYAPNIYENDSSIILTSGRPNENGIVYGRLGEHFSDNYRFKKTGADKWEEVTAADNFKVVNSIYNDGAGTFSKDKTKFYVTNCSDKVKEKESNQEGECAIFVSEFKDGKWEKPVKLNKNINQPGSWNAQPALSANNDTLFFVSKRKGGIGNHDLWYSVNLGGPDNWGPAVNMGERINTTETEMSPYYDKVTGTLFFASNGHIGFGGLDVFRTTGGNFDEIENMGLPFNSNRDDFYFSLGNEYGYISTNRVGGQGSDDIYTFNRTSKTPVLVDINLDNAADAGKNIDISSQIIDVDSKMPAGNVAVVLKDKEGNVIAKTTTNADGNFRFEKLPSHVDYLVELDVNDVELTDKVKFMVHSLEIHKSEVKVINHTAYKTLVAFVNVDSLGKGFETVSIESKVISDPKSTASYKVIIADEMGKTLYEVNTAADGSFKFKDIPMAGNIKVLVEVPNGLSAYKVDKAKITGAGNNVKTVPFLNSNKAKEINRDMPKNALSLTIQSDAFNKKTNKTLPNTGIILQDEKGKEVARTYTNAKGHFKFTQVPIGVKYKVGFEEKNLDYAYKPLVQDTVNSLSEVALRSSVMGKGGKPMAGVNVQLIDTKGKVVQTAVSDAKGEFKFSNLPLDVNFRLNIADKIPDVSIGAINYDTIRNVSSLTLTSMLVDSKSKMGQANVMVKLLDENGKVLKTTMTDEKGNFHFTNLPNDVNYQLEYLAANDNFGNIFDFSDLKVVASDETAAKIPFENVYFDSNSFEIRPEGKKTLDELVEYYKKNPFIQIEMNGNADSKGSAIYNLILSQKRAMKVVEYLTQRGVKRSDIVETAQGATKPIQTNDTEAGRALNRRAELYIVGDPHFRPQYVAYVVEQGMDVAGVAKKFDLKEEELKKANNLTGNQLTVNTPLRIHKIGEPDKYTALVADNNAAKIPTSLESAQKQSGIFLPLSFTSGQEEFKIEGVENLKNEKFSLKIFDKFGNIVFESKEPTKGWNGTMTSTGKATYKGVFTYLLKATTTDGEQIEKVGNLSKLD